MKVGKEESDIFSIQVGLRKRCVMSPWLFNLFMDGTVKKLNIRVLDITVALGIRRVEWNVKRICFYSWMKDKWMKVM